VLQHRLVLAAYRYEVKRARPLVAGAVRETVAAAAGSLRLQARVADAVRARRMRADGAWPPHLATATRSSTALVAYLGKIAYRGTFAVARFAAGHAFGVTAICVAIGAGAAIGLFA
jgi:hypothetical protein